MKRPVIIIIALLCCLIATAQTSSRIRYVKVNGSYTADGTSWDKAKNNIQDAINDLRATGDGTGAVYVAAGTYYPTESTETNADGTLYTAIKIYEGISVYGGFAGTETSHDERLIPDERQINIYKTTTTNDDGTTSTTTTIDKTISISEYKKNADSYPQRWSMANTTTISGDHSSQKISSYLEWNGTKNNYTTQYPGNSYHVVWFATNGFDSNNRANALTKKAIIDGFTITGGYASNRITTSRNHTSYGGGVYMVDGSIMRNCRITENASMRRGGGIYLDGGGKVEACMIFKNQCAGVGVVEGYGGGICLDGKGLLSHSVVMLNSSRIGGGLALCHDDATTNKAYPMATGCVVNNNSTTAEGGGVFMYQGGTINHLTIVRNKCWGADVVNDGRRLGRTGGLYIDKEAHVYNTVAWGNEGLNDTGANAVQYAAYTTSSSEMPEVYFSAFSQNEITDWSGSKRTSVYTLAHDDATASSSSLKAYFTEPSVTAGITTLASTVSWSPKANTDLRGKGIKLKDYNPSDATILEAGIESDMFGKSFAPRCMIGAICPVDEDFTIALLAPVDGSSTSTGTIPTLFVDPSGSNKGTENVGAAWKSTDEVTGSPIYMVNDALTYFRKKQNSDGKFTFNNVTYSKCQILVKQGTSTNVSNYGDENESLRSSCLEMVSNVSLYGGYDPDLTGIAVNSRNPKAYPTRITANVSAGDYTRNAYHVVKFDGVSNVTLDGFQFYGGNASNATGSDDNKNGGGVLVLNTESKSMTNNALKNCVIANCTSEQGAGVMIAASRAQLTMENCIVHNNEATTSSNNAAIAVTSGTLTINHCTIRGNVGYAVYNGGGTVTMDNSVAHANMSASATSIPTSGTFLCFSGTFSGSNNLWDSDDTYSGLSNTGTTLNHTYGDTENYPTFVNPTTTIGVQTSLEDVTKYGGDPDFTPTYPNPMINAASTASMSGTDLTCNTYRSNGGAADIGALEDTKLPKYGYTYYVRTTDKGGSDNNDGLSWATAFATVRKAVNTAYNSTVTIDTDGHKPEVWVAAGTYSQSPVTSSNATDYDSNNTNSCFNIREGVNVYGAFPATGNPGKNERQPLISSSIYNVIDVPKSVNDETAYKNNYINTYETILKPESSGYRVLGQGYDSKNSKGNTFSIATEWDGFTITGGSLVLSSTGDGGGGAEIFTGMTLKDCVVTDNSNKGSDTGGWDNARAGGIFCNGGNIVNCYIINNTLSSGSTSVGAYYGGGAYLLSGTMYNCVVANNSITANFADGGGLFLENATFFNNTVVYNTAKGGSNTNGNSRTSGGITIYNVPESTGTNTLKLYNCIVAGNVGFDKTNNTGNRNIARQGGTTIVTLYNCLLDTDPKNYESSILYNNCSNYTSTSTNWYDIFKDVQETNLETFNLCNYRLNGTTGTINSGIDEPPLANYQKVDWGKGDYVKGNGTTITNVGSGNGYLELVEDEDNNGTYNRTIEYKGTGGNYNMVEATGGDYKLTSRTFEYDKGNGTWSFSDGQAFTQSNNGNYTFTASGNQYTWDWYSGYAYYGAWKRTYSGNGSNRKYTYTFDNSCESEYELDPITWYATGYTPSNTTLYSLSGSFTNTGSGDYNVTSETYEYVGAGNGDHKLEEATDGNINVSYTYVSSGGSYKIQFVGIGNGSYIYSGSGYYNVGSGKGNYVSSDVIDLSTYTDMDYTDRIQDCRVDIGAYEYNGAKDITPDTGTTDGEAIFYVSQNGSGDRSAGNADNAACWEKLQKVLDAAGRYKAENSSKDVIVKLAGYEYYQPRRSTEETSTSEENPRKYSIIVPRGVIVKGGYSDVTGEAFSEDYRDVLNHPTILTGKYQSDGNPVNVYHTITFTENTYDADGNISQENALSDDTKFGKAILDGLFITGGMAEGTDTDNKKGGAAVVTDYAHIRNCIIYGNEAKENGGALYLKPGAMVSGCIIMDNTAEGNGGAIYVEDIDEGDKNSIIFTSTIVGNTADSGGGVYFPTDNTNAVRINSTVLWQNSASSNENIAGLLNPTSVSSSSDSYPLSFCAVENMRVAGINNISVNTENSKGTRFDKETTEAHNISALTNFEQRFFYLQKSSALARAGMAQDDWEDYRKGDYPTLEENDLAGVKRTKYAKNVYIEIGARAFDGELIATASSTNIMYRLFVAPADKSNATTATALQEQTEITYYQQKGSCMDNPMSHLDEALEYIRNARKDTKTIYDGTTTISEEVKDKVFEIYLSGGTYYPYRNLSGTYTESRDKTFAVPEGVHIYGGIDPESHYAGKENTIGNDIANEITISKSKLGNTDNINDLLIYPTETILDARKHRDHNANNIVEPWEMAQQTILSGEVVNGTNDQGSYHVIMCIADADIMGALPPNQKKKETDATAYSGKGDGTEPHELGKRVVIDGVTISDGEAYGYSDKVISKDTYYKGGAICVQGNWTTEDIKSYTYTDTEKKIERPVGYRDIPLEVRYCQFSNNKAGMGGAIFTDGELTVFGCRFVQNYAKDGKENNNEILLPGRGGCINSSSDVTVVNTLFANNETKHDNGDGENYGGVFVAGEYSKVNMINCDLVRNKSAAGYPAMYVYGNANDHVNIVNTLFWGNEASSSGKKLVINKIDENGIDENGTDVDNNQLWFCAYEEGCWSKPVTATVVDKIRDFRKAYYNYDSDKTIPQMLAAYNDSITDNKYKINNAAEINNNIILSSDNDALDGPNFISPSTTAGVGGYMQSADWMMGRLNNLVDNGWTYLEQQVGLNETTFVTRDGKDGSGIYLSTAQQMNGRDPERLRMAYGNDAYMAYDGTGGKNMYRISPDPNPTHEQSYIDIGVYEYQHVKLTQQEGTDTDSLWVCEKENTSSLTSDGSEWSRATSDLQRAIETLLSSRNGHKKKIMLLKGTYQPVYTISGNLAFTIQTEFLNSGSTNKTETENGVQSLTIQGGYSNEIKEVYDVEDYPAEFYSADRSSAEESTQGYVFCITNAEQIYKYSNGNSIAQGVAIPITFDGITFYNNKGLTTTKGAAIYYKDQYKSESGTDGSSDKKTTTPLDAPIDGSKKLTLKNCKIVASGGGVSSDIPSAMYVGKGGGKALIYNTLFHSNYGDPLEAYGTTVVNCTFALNGGQVKLMTDGDYTSAIHNSLLWKNNPLSDKTSWGDQLSLEGTDMTNNAIQGYSSTTDTNTDLSSDNDDVIKGPNFIDPKEEVTKEAEMLERDFGLNPSNKTLSKGDSITYYLKVFGNTVTVKETTYTVNDESLEGSDAETIKKGIYNVLKNETDLGGNARIYGGGLERGAYECLVQTRRVLYVNPNVPANTKDGWSWENAFGKSQLQKAVDAAAVYAASNNEDAYVFVKGYDATLGESLTLRDNVKVFGNIPTTYLTQCGYSTESSTSGEEVSDDQITAYLTLVNSDRPGVATPSAKHTIITGVSSPENTPFTNYSLVDGFVITNEESQKSPIINVSKDASLVLRNSIVADNNTSDHIIADINNGLLYNVLFRDNTTGDGKYIVNLGENAYMVNCTVGKKDGVSTTDRVSNSIVKTYGDNDAPFIPYLACAPLKSDKNLQYQLHENAYSIDNGDKHVDESTTKIYPNSTIKDKFPDAINYATDRDLLGNPRLISSYVDKGCYETWNVPADETMTAKSTDNEYPHEGSVVYIHDGGNLLLDKTNGFTSDNPFSPAYLLVCDGGSLYGQGNYINLPYVAVERKLTGKYLLMALPYKFDLANVSTPTYGEGYAPDDKRVTETSVTSPSAYYYNGEGRAANNYSFKESNTSLWWDGTNNGTAIASGSEIEANDGWLLNLSSAAASESSPKTYRFTAFGESATDYVYTEDGTDKKVILKQHDKCDTNNATTPTSDYEFTNEFNMGWNLKGLPYLVSDYFTGVEKEKYETATSFPMNIPHIVYTMKDDGSYNTPINSWEENSKLSVGDGFFTQTAVIGDEETLTFKTPEYTTRAAATKTRAITISNEGGEDEVVVNPVTENASLSYTIGSDGAKLLAMNDTLPQIYVVGANDARMSLASKAPVEEDIRLGFLAKRAGTYTVKAPSNSPQGGEPEAESLSEGDIWLTDHMTGTVVNLSESDYTMTVDGEGEYLDRLTIRFSATMPVTPRGNSDGNSYTIKVNGSSVTIYGLAVGDNVRIVTAGGALFDSFTARNTEETRQLHKGYYVVNINGYAKTILCR